VTQFTFLDWIVLAIVAYSVVTSVIRGFVREVLGLLTVVVGLLVASWFYPRVSGLLEGVLRTENQAYFASFAALFLGTLLVGFAVVRIVQKFFEFAHIEWVDRLLGGAFGLVRGWLLAAVVFLTLTSFGIQSDAVANSSLSHYFLPAVRLIARVVPFDLKARFMVGYDEVERWWADQSEEGPGDSTEEVIPEQSGPAPFDEPAEEQAPR